LWMCGSFGINKGFIYLSIYLCVCMCDIVTKPGTGGTSCVRVGLDGFDERARHDVVEIKVKD